MPTGKRTSIYDGQVIEMRKFTGNFMEWKLHLGDASLQIASATQGHCEWRNVPRLLGALENESKKLLAVGITPGTFFDNLTANEVGEMAAGCGSVRELMQEHAE